MLNTEICGDYYGDAEISSSSGLERCRCGNLRLGNLEKWHGKQREGNQRPTHEHGCELAENHQQHGVTIRREHEPRGATVLRRSYIHSNSEHETCGTENQLGPENSGNFADPRAIMSSAASKLERERNGTERRCGVRRRPKESTSLDRINVAHYEESTLKPSRNRTLAS